jgi:hypothetical protein
MFEIDVTDFLASHSLKYFSGSIAELGQDAGPQTWEECNDKAEEWKPLDSGDKRETFINFCSNAGFSEADDMRAWPDSELQALCIQWIAGDARECGIDGADLDSIDWDQIEEDRQNGQCPSSLFRGDDGRIYWRCSEC